MDHRETKFDGKRAIILNNHPHKGAIAICMGADRTIAGWAIKFKRIDTSEEFYVFKPEDVTWMNEPPKADRSVDNTDADILEIKPIPLTEEWLIKFGFDCRDGSVSNKWHIGINEVTHDWLFDLVWLKGRGLQNDYPFYRNGKFEIKYVHQLQNLYYALTGEELEVKQ